MNEKVQLPRQFDVKGEVTVTLFDTNGKKVQEVKGHNFIADGMKYAYRAMMLTAFTRQKATDGTTGDPVGDPFRKMLLTTASHEPDPKIEWFARGEVIGYAYTNDVYAGGDQKRGSYNKNESFRGDDRMRVVIDFTTDSANGTIESVYFMTDLTRPLFSISEVPGVKKPFGPINLCVVKYNNRYYALGDGRSSRSSVLNVYDDLYNLIETVNLPFDAVDLTIYNNEIYLARWNSYTNLYKIPLSNLSASPTLISIPGSSEVYGIAYDSVNQRFMVRRSGLVELYDTSFNLLSSNPETMYSSGIISSSYYSSQNRRLTYADGAFFDHYFVVNPDGSLTDRGGGVPITGVFDDYIVSDSGYLFPKHGISSRYKLPSPVTKTSSHTMKVTYDFIFPDFYSEGY